MTDQIKTPASVPATALSVVAGSVLLAKYRRAYLALLEISGAGQFNRANLENCPTIARRAIQDCIDMGQGRDGDIIDAGNELLALVRQSIPDWPLGDAERRATEKWERLTSPNSEYQTQSLLSNPRASPITPNQ